ncbi:MAG: DHA2 family efflux MFS transporter permease subunit [Acidimicrobiaceae bacterium]|nr:DHA2 family efflux MFS transporter permease subunit [Acidimicrobiaceae bacterium]MXZ63982.1 DHA2 family efflux MFS transporter permease subunit [Acidimicrobiaceae bacterium]MYA13778.1 DHA2 family efflux MFS transporter permease subunit [Acidimicrobiaceae bacterium]MYF31956.1 DHA2 family efflux MFS transporter permease subunit [Acidimicrobiaceae bacterium]MYG76973.1 DHA2 family efflux MFS transporter permease subunit [Acidimicrobiaceae bacterium]
MKLPRWPARPRREAGQVSDRRRLSLAVVLAGTLVGFLDTTTVNVALPSIASSLGIDTGIEWVVTAHLLALGVTQAPTGWLADRWGLRPVFLRALGGFGVFAVLSAASPNLVALVLARVGQGVCSGAALSVGTLLLYEMTPPETRGRVIGYAGGLFMIAPALGPLLSGWIVTSASWRWLFLGFAPVCGLVIMAGARLVPHQSPGERRPIDLPGTLLLTVSLVGFLTACSYATDWGLSSTVFIATIVTSVLVAVAFWLRAVRTPHPLIDPKLYSSRDFSLCMAVVGTLALSQFARQVFIPLEMQAVRGLSPVSAGAVLTPSALLAAAAMPLVGRFTDRFGAKPPIVAGLLLAAISTGLLTTTTRSTPMWLVVAYVAGSGVAASMVAMPATLLSLSSVVRRLRTQASAVRNLTGRVSGALGTAVIATVIVSDVGSLTELGTEPGLLARAQSAYNRGFAVATVIMLAGVVVSLGLRNRRPSDDDEMGWHDG